MIGIIGLGFVGLTTALGFASKGYTVCGIDVDTAKRAKIRSGKIPFYEPSLEDALGRHQDKTFFVVDSLEALVSRCQAIFFCVGTPTGTHGEANLHALEQAIKDSATFVRRGEPRHFVIKSTVPPSSTSEIVRPLIEALGFKVGSDIGLTNNPEFLREGCAWEDFIHPDRIVIGEHDAASGQFVAELYAPFQAPVFRVSLNTAEFVKYLSNTMLASMISFSNEMAMIADHIGKISIPDAFRLLHLDRRWYGAPAKMTSYLYPGCGFGGYCLPKDTLAMVAAAEANGADARMLRDVLAVNEQVKEYLVEKIAAVVRPESRIGIMGLAFKPQSDDVRETPARDIIQKLIARGYTRLTGYDPLAMESFRAAYQLPIAYANTLPELVDGSDILVVTTSWPEFKLAREILAKKPVIDGRYFLEGA